MVNSAANNWSGFAVVVEKKAWFKKGDGSTLNTTGAIAAGGRRRKMGPSLQTTYSKISKN